MGTGGISRFPGLLGASPVSIIFITVPFSDRAASEFRPPCLLGASIHSHLQSPDYPKLLVRVFSVKRPE